MVSVTEFQDQQTKLFEGFVRWLWHVSRTGQSFIVLSPAGPRNPSRNRPAGINNATPVSGQDGQVVGSEERFITISFRKDNLTFVVREVGVSCQWPSISTVPPSQLTLGVGQTGVPHDASPPPDGSQILHPRGSSCWIGAAYRSETRKKK